MKDSTQTTDIKIVCGIYHGRKRNAWTRNEEETRHAEVSITNDENTCCVYKGIDDLAAAKLADDLGRFFGVTPKLAHYDWKEIGKWVWRDER